MKKIKWGILSTAYIAHERVVPAINKTTDGEVYAVASRDLSKAKKAALDWGADKAYASYEELLADPDVDAVYCPLPTGMHREWSLKCLEAGKPLLCEKPIAVWAEEAQEVFKAFEKAHLLISEAYMYRFHPLNLKVRELVQGGAIGELRSIQSIFNVNVDRSNIRFNEALGGGSILDLGCYCIGIARFITGMEPVDGYSFAHIGQDSNVDETRVGILRFPDNVMSTFTCSLTTHMECAYEVFGSNGRIRVQRGGMIPWPGEAFDVELWKGDQFERITIPDSDHYEIMTDAFNRVLLDGKHELVPHSESLRNLKAMDMLRKVE